jgi:hypothetical protein
MISTRGQTRSPGSRRTATAVAVSGQVATPSAADVRGATRPPKTRPYQVWTAAWFLASQGTPGSWAERAASTSASRAGSERLQEPGGRAHQGLEPPRQVGYSDGIRIHRIG